jgi:hypothetical protein
MKSMEGMNHGSNGPTVPYFSILNFPILTALTFSLIYTLEKINLEKVQTITM